MKKVSIIIPVYNVISYIEKTIVSCIEQTLSDIEIIAVNDGSTDGSGEFLDSFGKLHSNIIIVNKSNGGVTSARNEGIKYAQGKYIFFLDGDDYLEKDAIEVMYKVAERENADYVVGDYLIDYSTHKVAHKFFDFGIVDNVWFIKYIFRYGDFYLTGRLLRKSFYDKIIFDVPFDITFGEDNLSVEQLGFNAKKIAKVNHFVLNYVQRRDSVTNRLSEYDLQKRAKACNYLLTLLKRQGVYTKVKSEVTLWALREINDSVRRGYVDFAFSKEFLNINNILTYRDYLSNDKIFILLSACISLSKTVKILKFIRRI